MKRWLRTFVFAIAAAVLVGYGLAHLHAGQLPIMAKVIIVALIALAISWYAFKWYHRPKPFEKTRKFARMMYHNGLISMEELQDFYDRHPEVEDFDGNSSTGN